MVRPTSKRRTKPQDYRGGAFERRLAKSLEDRGVDPNYEGLTVRYQKPPKPSRYTPDFPLPNGILIEAKGWFTSADRQKHRYIQACHPDLDIRFVFAKPHNTLGKLSTTTYADWCDKHGFLWADGVIPDEWLKEPANKRRLAALKKAIAR